MRKVGSDTVKVLWCFEALSHQRGKSVSYFQLIPLCVFISNDI